MRKSQLHIKKWVCIFCAGCLMGSLLIMTGCNKLPASFSGTEPTSPASSAETTKEPYETTEKVQPTLSEEEKSAASLYSLRQAMGGTSKVIAASYFSWTYDVMEPAELLEHIQVLAPELCEEFPFLLSIPEENIIGQSGEIYCIVPADPDACITVRRRIWDSEDELDYTELVYSSDSGEPILLFCNSGGFEPDTEVSISSGDDVETLWYPRLNSEIYIDPLFNYKQEEVLLDFTPYAEIMNKDYLELQEDGCVLPSVENLIGGTWATDEIMEDNRVVNYVISFDQDTAHVLWTTGYEKGYYNEFLDAAWDLTYESGFAVLTIDFREFAGVLRYNLLYDEETGWLYTMVDASTGVVTPSYEKRFRYLYPISMNAPDPLEMVGTWERFRSEFEGYEEEDATGACTIRISGESKDSMSITYVDGDYPDSCYENRSLSICLGALYYECGNDIWRAEVDYVGAYETTYTVTLLNDVTLLLQYYWLLDGAPTVSYEWFRRVG